MGSVDILKWAVMVGAVIAVVGIVGFLNSRKKRREAEQYNAAIERERQALLNDSDTVLSTPLDPASYGYRPVGRENLLAVEEDTARMELKSSGTYRTRGSSVSIPIVKGVRYRVGSGSVRTEKSWQVTATGRLLVTDKAVVFESPEKNERMTWGQIADIELLIDGYRIAKRTGPPRTFVVDPPDPRFAAIVELMLTRVD